MSTPDGYVSGKNLYSVLKTFIVGTSRWKGRPDGRNVRMEDTTVWKGRPDGRDAWMKGTSRWKGRPDERNAWIKRTSG
nr:hypothetical protein [Tanacetum cinerariifolium]